MVERAKARAYIAPSRLVHDTFFMELRAAASFGKIYSGKHGAIELKAGVPSSRGA